MGNRHYLFDIDETCIETFRLNPVLHTRDGKAYLPNNIGDFETHEFHPSIKEVITDLHKLRRVGFLTNSPGDYAIAVLRKHGFPTDAPIYSNADKPSSKSIKEAGRVWGVPLSDILIVGDQPTDVYAGHACDTPSLGAAWSSRINEARLKISEPSEVLTDPEDLDYHIGLFDQGHLNHQPRRFPKQFQILNPNYDDIASSGNHLGIFKNVGSMGVYTVYEPGSGASVTTSRVLDLKKMRSFTPEEINQGAYGEFFYLDRNTGSPKFGKGTRLKDTYTQVVRGLLGIIESWDLDGSVQVLAIPNSYPPDCYITHVNRSLTNSIVNLLDNESASGPRIIQRVFPKPPAHNRGSRNLKSHFKTMGIKRGDEVIADHCILIDDVRTSGAQAHSVARLLRRSGFRGDLHLATVGGDPIEEELTF